MQPIENTTYDNYVLFVGAAPITESCRLYTTTLYTPNKNSGRAKWRRAEVEADAGTKASDARCSNTYLMV